MKSASIHVRLPEPLRQALEDLATERGESPSEIVRDALKAYLDRLKRR